jgi:hypothetical protein
MPEQTQETGRRQVRTELFFSEQEYDAIKKAAFAHDVRRPALYSAAIIHFLGLPIVTRKRVLAQYIADAGDAGEDGDD